MHNKKGIHISVFITIFCCLSVGFPTQVIAESSPKKGDVGIFEHLGEQIPKGLMFKNENGEEVVLDELLDKPTVLSFVYYNCPGLCSPLLDGIAEVIQQSDEVLGKDYQMITISINKDDTPKLGKQKKGNYTGLIKKKFDEASWIWLTSDSATIAKVTDAVGYKFQRNGDDFAHGAAIVAVSQTGKITRYLYGTYFLTFDLKMAIVEANEGRTGTTLNRVLKYCFSYDPAGKKYVFNITKISGTIILLFAGALFLILMFKKKKSNRITT